MLLGNAVGAIGIGYLCFAIFKNTDLFATALTTADSKLSFNDFNDYLSCIVRSILCGLCVYLAVKSFAYKRISLIGTLLLILFVFVFVYSGFQHCIANMFYFSFANAWSWGVEAFINIILVIIFNSVGPIFGILLFNAFKGQ